MSSTQTPSIEDTADTITAILITRDITVTYGRYMKLHQIIDTLMEFDEYGTDTPINVLTDAIDELIERGVIVTVEVPDTAMLSQRDLAAELVTDLPANLIALDQ